jgi:hypothetical protein
MVRSSTVMNHSGLVTTRVPADSGLARARDTMCETWVRRATPARAAS